MKTNTYFEELDRIARDFEEKHEAHKALKQQIIDTKGWDSEELKAWYKEEEETFQYPISAGARKAYRAWRYSDTDEVIMDDFTWERERHDFIDTLRKAGIQTLVVTNQSTGLMEDLHGYAIIDTPDILMICRKGDLQSIRNFVNDVTLLNS